VQTGIFPLGGIRVRAIRCEHYAIADGRAGLSFLDILLRIGEGRSLEARQTAGAHIFDVVSTHLDNVFAPADLRCPSTCRSTTAPRAGSAIPFTSC
jgi:5-carboxymethyl-2-hydroxymuconate isomerase